ncbi:hypothetical protein KKF64_01260 [Patescibacteria group bacterium]|nr:hypothetical protein [Patescibacteria group bacterium]
MEEIFHNKELLGILVNDFEEGSVPLTDDKECLQVLTLRHKAGEHTVAPHIHSPRKKETEKLQECLIVRKGRIKIDLYSSDGSYVKSMELKQGELFVRVSGGYGVKFLEDSEIFEIKNGPFNDDKVLI